MVPTNAPRLFFRGMKDSATRRPAGSAPADQEAARIRPGPRTRRSGRYAAEDRSAESGPSTEGSPVEGYHIHPTLANPRSVLSPKRPGLRALTPPEGRSTIKSLKLVAYPSGLRGRIANPLFRRFESGRHLPEPPNPGGSPA